MYGYALYKDGKDTTLSYPLENFHSDVAGRSFHNGRFIQRMREKAATLPKYFPFPFTLIKLFYGPKPLIAVSCTSTSNGCPPNFPFSVRLEQGTVTSLIEEKGTIKGVQYKTKAGQEVTSYAPLTIVCDGCFSNLRRSLCNPQVK